LCGCYFNNTVVQETTTTTTGSSSSQSKQLSLTVTEAELPSLTATIRSPSGQEYPIGLTRQPSGQLGNTIDDLNLTLTYLLHHKVLYLAILSLSASFEKSTCF